MAVRSVGIVIFLLGVTLAVPATARAQGAAPTVDNPYYAAPGNYGMAWGSASYGMKRTYSEFSSPYGGGYGYGYGPSSILPGRHGLGLWRPGFDESSRLNGGPNSYRTFAVPYVPGRTSSPPPPPVGVYAPGFGPTFVGW